MWAAVLCLPLLMAATDEDAFVRALDGVRARARTGRHEEARELLLAAIEEHGPADHVRVRAGRIRDELRRIAFELEGLRPDPLEFVQGEVVDWDERRRKLTLRYDRTTPQHPRKEPAEQPASRFHKPDDSIRPVDFLIDDVYLLHPLHFTGEFEVTVRASGSSGRTPPVFVYGFGTDDVTMIVIGDAPPYGRYPPLAMHLEDGEPDVVAKGRKLVRDAGPIDVTLSVGRTGFSLKVDGKTRFSGPNPSKGFGQCALSGFRGIEEIEISGKVSDTWFDELIDDELEARLARFEQAYDVNALLPPWLHVELVDDTLAGRPTLAAYPEGGQSRHDEPALRIAALREAWRFDDALAYLEELRGETSVAFRLYMEAVLRAEAGDVERARKACGAVLVHHPDWRPAQVLTARLEAQGGEPDRARARLDALLEEDPLLPAAHEERARMLLRSGDLAGARSHLDQAILAGVPAEALSDLDGLLLRADRGPEWDDASKQTTRHYVVHSDAGGDVCHRVGRTLEEAHALYTRVFGRARRPEGAPARSKVYVFARQAAYLDHCDHLWGVEPTMSAGLYSPELQQLLVWIPPDRDALDATVRHEGFHQFADVHIDGAPIWFDEGLAEYFETFERVRGRLEPGAVHADHVALMAQAEWTPLEQFVRLSRADFMARAPLHYPQAWALVHYLLHSDRDNKAALLTLWEAYADGRSHEEALAEAFPEGLAAVEQGARQHVLALFMDANKERLERLEKMLDGLGIKGR